jgi:hypothetical protein
MSDNQAPARPSQVTMAGWMAVVGSALLVATLFDAMAGMHSLETRQAIQELLSTPPGSDLHVSVAEVIDLLRVATLVAGAAAAAAAVLGVSVLRRHNAARVGLTVTAAALVVTTPLTGSLLSLPVALAVTMLWTQPARDWFAGRPPAPAPAHDGLLVSESPQRRPDAEPWLQASAGEQPPGSSGDRPGEGSTPWPRMPDAQHGPGERVPPPTQGYGSPQQAPQPGPTYPSQPGYPGYGQPPYGGSGYPPPNERRPATVVVAAGLTWLFSGLTAVLWLIVVGMLLGARDRLVNLIETNPTLQNYEQQTGQSIPTDAVIGAVWVWSVIGLVWCLIAMVLAFLAFRRANWARITLAVSAGVTALVSIVALPVTAGNLISAAAVVVLLFTGGANQWYARRPGYPSYPGPYGGPPPGGSPGGQPPRYPGEQPPRYPGEQPPRYPGEQPPSGDQQQPPKNVW